MSNTSESKTAPDKDQIGLTTAKDGQIEDPVARQSLDDSPEVGEITTSVGKNEVDKGEDHAMDQGVNKSTETKLPTTMGDTEKAVAEEGKPPEVYTTMQELNANMEEEEREEGEWQEPKVVDISEVSTPFQSYSRSSRSQSPTTPEMIFDSPPYNARPDDEPSLDDTFAKYTGTYDIDEFENNERIGQGTFGEVTIATHNATGKKVALKRIIVHKEKEGLPITSIREILILKAMKHPNVIPFDGMAFGKANDEDEYEPATLYMVFPYMHHDLFGLLKNPLVTLQPNQIKAFAKQLLEGLAYLHKNELLHRDLKSANILIDNAGNVKIGDFGLARRHVPEESPSSLTPTVVTLWYRPPEILLEEQKYNSAVDMWGFGCIFAEMWERTPIFQASTEPQALDKIFGVCGTPKGDDWPEYASIMARQKLVPKQEPRRIREIFRDRLDYYTITFIDSLLLLNPARRPSAEDALRHDYFNVEPTPAEPGTIDFLGWPESHEMGIQDKIHEQTQKAKEMAKKMPGASREAFEIHPPRHSDIVIEDGVPRKRRALPATDRRGTKRRREGDGDRDRGHRPHTQPGRHLRGESEHANRADVWVGKPRDDRHYGARHRDGNRDGNRDRDRDRGRDRDWHRDKGRDGEPDSSRQRSGSRLIDDAAHNRDEARPSGKGAPYEANDKDSSRARHALPPVPRQRIVYD